MSPSSNVSLGESGPAPLSDFIAGGAGGATFAVDLPAGQYAVSVLVRCADDTFGAGPWPHSSGGPRHNGCDQGGNCGSCNFKTAATGVRDGSPRPDTSNRGMAGDRVRAGVLDVRAASFTVGQSGLVLNFTGQAVGPQMSVDHGPGPASWLVSAVLIHKHAAAGSLPPQARASLAAHKALADSAVGDWALIGPFNDTTSTGLYRSVSAADGHDRNLSHSHPGKGARGPLAWRRVRGIGPVAVAASLGDDAKGSAAMLQTSIHCPSNASAHISFSTAGTGVLSVWNAAGEQLANATDQVYAGLFDEEVVLNVSLAAGWNDLQIKTLSHYSTAAGWEAQASVDTGASGCAIDACDPYSAAPCWPCCSRAL